MNSFSGIFAEPQGSLLADLRERKTLLEQAMPGQPYCSHPPHGTLLYGDFGPPELWLPPLRAALAVIPAFTLATDQWQQFPADPLTGGHTVAFRVAPNPALSRLQLTVAETLAPFARTDIARHPLIGTEPFATSLRRFGSAFVGPHWIPHFTIGSPRVPADDPLLARLMAGSPRHEFQLGSLSLWRVGGGRHDRLQELALAFAQP